MQIDYNEVLVYDVGLITCVCVITFIIMRLI